MDPPVAALCITMLFSHMIMADLPHSTLGLEITPVMMCFKGTTTIEYGKSKSPAEAILPEALKKRLPSTLPKSNDIVSYGWMRLCQIDAEACAKQQDRFSRLVL